MLPSVLVLDDDVNILLAFEDFFKKEQCAMLAASTAEDALKFIESVHVDLLITDIRLRSNSGVTFFLNVKTIRPQLPVIVITGYPESIDENTLTSMGADFILVKPLELEKLRHAVRACLQKRNVFIPDSKDPHTNSGKELQ